MRTVAVNKAVPVKSVRPKPSNQPRWFNRKANKLITKHRKTYNKYQESGDPFLLMKYKQERRSHRVELRQIEQDNISTKICKPLETANSKPFLSTLEVVSSCYEAPYETQD